ncbi:hypothetical protein OS493_024980 [Desmophyllum pertusum]|uniref:Uncharacterized protein n=1 Tax=Desmophyllum pertusum TaxID=174260 RepID=A0A9W9YLH8_9CNID|nr:hypothetical protein OS493_024980 [Desmophyllum pertusum]
MFPVAITMLGAFVMGLKIDFKQNEIRTTKCSTIPDEIQESSLKDVFVNFRNIAFIIIVLYFGVMDGVFVTFMFWYLTDINPSQATWAIGVAGAGRKHRGSHWRAFCFSKKDHPTNIQQQYKALCYSCYLGIGFGVGAMIGGFLMDIIGGSWDVSGVRRSNIVYDSYFPLFLLVISKLLERRKNNKKKNYTA